MRQYSEVNIVLFKTVKKAAIFIHMLLLCFFLLIGAGYSHAQDDAGESDKPMPAIYLPIKPAFVVNYGGEGRLRYLKTEISVRLKNNETAGMVRHHLPLIRNNLVMLFAAQTDDDLQSQEGREMLRGKVLEQVKLVLEQEGGDADGVVDAFFSTFVVQK